jgi:hypothetical protein
VTLELFNFIAEIQKTSQFILFKKGKYTNLDFGFLHPKSKFNYAA